MNIQLSDIHKAIESATKTRQKRYDVVRFMNSYADNVACISSKLTDESYMDLVEYREMTIVNNDTKVRHIHSPRLYTLILQHLCRNLLLPYYEAVDIHIGLNCKDRCGITAKEKRKSVLKRAKLIFYDLRDYSHILCIDQRKCYDHIKVKTFRKALKYIGVPKWLNDFACTICFYNGRLPIGTPTSPLVHHIIMVKYDKFLLSISGQVIRYADNTFIAFKNAEDANTALWRIKNFWWYELGMRAKKNTAHIFDINKHPIDICGYVIKRIPNKTIVSHNKGVTTVRSSIFKHANKSTQRNWGSYFGILKSADCFNAMRKIENDMKLSQLTDKIKINRSLDADPKLIKDLAENGTVFTIYDYDLRYRGKSPDWIKCLIGVDEDGRERAYEFHGSYSGIAEFIATCEATYGKEALLPIEAAEVENRCGYVLKDSTNVIKYIEQ